MNYNMNAIDFSYNYNMDFIEQSSNICPKPTVKTLEQGVKYVHSQQ